MLWNRGVYRKLNVYEISTSSLYDVSLAINQVSILVILYARRPFALSRLLSAISVAQSHSTFSNSQWDACVAS